MSDTPPGQRQTSVAPDRRPLVALLSANAVSQMGNMMSAVAVPWFVLETTGSAARTGLTGAALAIGAVLPAILGGPLVDWFGFRRTSVLGDLASGATVAAIPLLYLTDRLTFWALLTLVFLFASLNAQGDTARLALLPGLARRAGASLDRASAADRAIARFGQLAGPVVAGVLIALIGASNVLFVHAGTFAVSSALVAIGVYRVGASEPDRSGAPRAYLSDLMEGLRFVRSNRLVLSMIVVAGIGNMLDVPLVSVILPVYAKTIFGSPTSLGIMLGALAAGALIGTILFGVWGRRLPRRRTFVACFVVAPLLLYGALAVTPPLAIVLVVAVVSGLIAGPINPLFLTVMQENTPPQLFGRVFGSLNALAQAGIPLGAVLAGFVVEGVGLVPTIAGMGVIYLTVTLALFYNRSLHRMETVPA